MYNTSNQPTTTASGGSFATAAQQTGVATIGQEQRSIPSSLQRVAAAIASLDHQIDQLTTRLQPVLGPDSTQPPTGSNESKDPVQPSQVSEMLNEYANKIRGFSVVLNNLEKRAQL